MLSRERISAEYVVDPKVHSAREEVGEGRQHKEGRFEIKETNPVVSLVSRCPSL